MEKVNVFTVRRTELPQEREIVWERDFPQVLNSDAGDIDLVPDRRVRLTEKGKRVRRELIAVERAKELDCFIVGVAIGSSAFAGFVAILLHVFGVG